MKRNQSGFTLIELVTVIVILGALAAVVTPQFVNLQDEANQAAVDGVAGNLASASSTNFAACKANSSECVSVGTCSDVASATIEGLPSGWSITGGGISVGGTQTCTVDDGSSNTADFTAIGTS